MNESKELIASFGDARLVRDQRGRYYIEGGSVSDRIEAREWISLFLHEAVPISA